MTKTNKSWYKRIGWIGIVLCGFCCAFPIIGTAVSIASLTALSSYLEKIGIIALGLAGFFFWYAWYSKRKKAKACATNCNTNCECKPETSAQNEQQ